MKALFKIPVSYSLKLKESNWTFEYHWTYSGRAFRRHKGHYHVPILLCLTDTEKNCSSWMKLEFY